jgi:hypothetical protein
VPFHLLPLYVLMEVDGWYRLDMSQTAYKVHYGEI